MTENYLF